MTAFDLGGHVDPSAQATGTVALISVVGEHSRGYGYKCCWESLTMHPHQRSREPGKAEVTRASCMHTFS